ncbi:hypothetical protein ADICYQ_5135 [Cyclobacterium qasimii M12-11B]|uniref:Uncharacterized protein n=1 Tax=Cyclobacterium qasimii M12-11B TaxID=641524 RepID=S7V6K4_9BACT|nr:hypothetical protein ADICYQ_5135 [Cyclobacterium qasimii M12-11B]
MNLDRSSLFNEINDKNIHWNFLEKYQLFGNIVGEEVNDKIMF